jgi:hypothetical protein
MTTTKDRIAQALYVLGCIGAAWFLLGFGLETSRYLRGWRRPGMEEDMILMAILVVASYGAGWCIRWIINGTSTSVLDYLLPRNPPP